MTSSFRAAGQAFADFVAWTLAVPIALWLRFDFSVPPGGWSTALFWGIAAGILHVAAGYVRKLYRGRYRFGSFDEVTGVVISASVVTLIGEIGVLLAHPTDLPRTVPLLAGGLALGMMLAGRFSLRFLRERVRTPRDGDRTLVYGAGDGGSQLVRAMVANRNSGYCLVGLLDDDPRKRHLRISGVRVRGTICDLEKTVDLLDVQVLVVAIANVNAAQLRDLDKRCRALGVQLRVIPSAVEIVKGAVRLSDVSDVTEEDLLGRRPVHTDESGIAQMLAGKRVLITGAGGSIGSELARQVNSYDPAFLGLLDRDESALHALHLSMFGKALLDTDDLILADIRDSARLREIMQQVRPDVVFHAAALKHLPMLEAAPSEAFKTNVLGTRNVLQAAYEAGTPVFVNISTDKAADPVSVLGHSKRTTERLTAGIQPPNDGRYLSVRFGNVLGSRGSMLTAFRAQIANGGPVTVTHQEVTRYFMTVKEAVHLVLQAATIGRCSETLILDMGQPVRIDDVAKHMIEKSGRDIEIVYTGLRDGEKLHEVLSSEQESGSRPLHPLVTHVQVPPLEVMALEEHWAHSCDASRAAMQLLGFALSARAAVDEMTAARDSLVAARDAVADSQPVQAKTFITAASESAEAASNRVNGPLWDVAAAVPGLGDTPQAAQAIATSLSQALTALRPLTDQLDVLDPSALISDNGRIDVAALESAVPAMKQAQPGLDAAVATMAEAPTDGLMLPQVSSAATEFTDQLASLQSSLNTAVRFGEIARPLLGADGEKRYFVGILNPNEARGTGGFLGSYAILSAKDGKISVDEVGSNTDLPNLDKLPPGLGKDFVLRYSDDPTLIGNMNLSPHFPSTAKIWLVSWQKKTGERLDGAIAADVVALGDVVQASGQPVSLPDGGSISGDQLADFAIKGIYEKFPTNAQAAERKAYQEAITTSAASILTQAPSPEAMAEALGQGLSEDRVVVWSADRKVERQLVDAGVGGSLAVGDGHNVQFVALNGSGSKLDAFLQRSLTYEVGRCVDEDGQVKSQVTVDLTSDIPLGERPPEYMVSLAKEGPTGPINVVLAQMHLPNDAEIDEVKVNGKSVSYAQFDEQGRPSVVLSVTLPPREQNELTFDFWEPASGGPGEVAIQPLGSDQVTQVTDESCEKP